MSTEIIRDMTLSYYRKFMWINAQRDNHYQQLPLLSYLITYFTTMLNAIVKNTRKRTKQFSENHILFFSKFGFSFIRHYPSHFSSSTEQTNKKIKKNIARSGKIKQQHYIQSKSLTLTDGHSTELCYTVELNCFRSIFSPFWTGNK